jgi:hypothetical protein
MTTIPSQDCFDWDAFMRDTLEASTAATGAWLRCLYKMRLSVTRGRICLPVTSYARLFGTSQDQAKAILTEIETLGIGDAVTESNGNVTLTNRRMFREWEARKHNAERQGRYRERHGSNAEVTEMSQNASVVVENKSLNNEIEKPQKGKVRKPKSGSRLPDPFPLTDEMIRWAEENAPGLRVVKAHANFIEYYTNLTTKKAFKLDWMLTWQRGMKLALEWQIADDAKNAVGKQTPGKWDGEEVTIDDAPCAFCGQDVCFSLHADERRAA